MLSGNTNINGPKIAFYIYVKSFPPHTTNYRKHLTSMKTLYTIKTLVRNDTYPSGGIMITIDIINPVGRIVVVVCGNRGTKIGNIGGPTCKRLSFFTLPIPLQPKRPLSSLTVLRHVVEDFELVGVTVPVELARNDVLVAVHDAIEVRRPGLHAVGTSWRDVT